MNSLLVNERPLHILPSLAQLFKNADAAVVLQQCHWLCNIKAEHQDDRTLWDGHYWCSYTYDQWQQKVIPWRSVRYVRQILSKLVATGVLICAKPQASNLNQTNWYRIDHEVLQSITQKQVASAPDLANCATSIWQTVPPGENTQNLDSEPCDPVFSDLANCATSSILKRSIKNTQDLKNLECEFSSNFEGNAKAENLDLLEPDVNQTSPVLPKNLTNGIGFNQEIPAENKFSAAPPENLPKAEAFAWWGERFEDKVFLRRKVESWAWDFKFLQSFGEWLLKDQAYWAKHGYTAQSAAQTVVRGALYGEKAGAHRGRLATYLCKDCQSPTPATTPQPVAPSAPAAPVSEYAELTDSQVTDQFLGQWQEIQAFPTKIREAMATAIQDSYTREFQRRYGQNWAGATLPELATTLQIAA